MPSANTAPDPVELFQTFIRYDVQWHSERRQSLPPHLYAAMRALREEILLDFTPLVGKVAL